ncbi:MAG: hypothetical protein HQL21_00650 [Candidatus Omnitrophica bacterium]|nr:hypothetical protein [Candidatus Omnitrophota bacterium]
MVYTHFFKGIHARLTAVCVLTCFIITTVFPSAVMAQILLPEPGTMVGVTSAFTPALLKGVQLDAKDPLRFNFIVTPGDEKLDQNGLEQEGMRFVRYFMAGLTLPEDTLWVNLSPHEKDRIIDDGFARTEMGEALLSEDYILKQLVSSLSYPDSDLGKKFWARVYAEAEKRLGTTDIPVEAFNKVWIVPEKAVIIEQGAGAFVATTHLKVMLERDYVAEKATDSYASSNVVTVDPVTPQREASEIAAREILIPILENEVNEGSSFGALRQIYNAMVLAAWYKKALKESILGKVYADQAKLAGIDRADPVMKEKIYQQYLAAFKAGAYNMVKEETSPSGDVIPRKYVSGGLGMQHVADTTEKITPAMATPAQKTAVLDHADDAQQLVVKFGRPALAVSKKPDESVGKVTQVARVIQVIEAGKGTLADGQILGRELLALKGPAEPAMLNILSDLRAMIAGEWSRVSAVLKGEKIALAAQVQGAGRIMRALNGALAPVESRGGITRNQFLKGALAVAAGLVMAGCEVGQPGGEDQGGGIWKSGEMQDLVEKGPMVHWTWQKTDPNAWLGWGRGVEMSGDVKDALSSAEEYTQPSYGDLVVTIPSQIMRGTAVAILEDMQKVRPAPNGESIGMEVGFPLREGVTTVSLQDLAARAPGFKFSQLKQVKFQATSPTGEIIVGPATITQGSAASSEFAMKVSFSQVAVFMAALSTSVLLWTTPKHADSDKLKVFDVINSAPHYNWHGSLSYLSWIPESVSRDIFKEIIRQYPKTEQARRAQAFLDVPPTSDVKSGIPFRALAEAAKTGHLKVIVDSKDFNLVNLIVEKAMTAQAIEKTLRDAMGPTKPVVTVSLGEKRYPLGFNVNGATGKIDINLKEVRVPQFLNEVERTFTLSGEKWAMAKAQLSQGLTQPEPAMQAEEIAVTDFSFDGEKAATFHLSKKLPEDMRGREALLVDASGKTIWDVTRDVEKSPFQDTLRVLSGQAPANAGVQLRLVIRGFMGGSDEQGAAPGETVLREQSGISDDTQRVDEPIQGGIDLTREYDLQIKRDGNGMPLPVYQQPIVTMKIDGFSAILINSVPVDLAALVGFRR